MNGREEFLRHEGDNLHCLLLQYHMLGYVERCARWIQWELIRI
jgi:hypothetical protein